MSQGWSDAHGKEKTKLGKYVYVHEGTALQNFPVQVRKAEKLRVKKKSSSKWIMCLYYKKIDIKWPIILSVFVVFICRFLQCQTFDLLNSESIRTTGIHPTHACTDLEFMDRHTEATTADS